MEHSPFSLLDADTARDNAEGATELDIYLYVAASGNAVDLRALIDRMFEELEWGVLRAATSIIVADDFDLGELDDARVKFIRASDAASEFFIRYREIEASPHDVLVCFGTCLPTIDVIGQLRTTLQEDEMASAAVPRVALEPYGHFVALGTHTDSAVPRLVDRTQCGELPHLHVIPEDLFPCFCISNRVIGNIDPPQEFAHLPDALIALLRAARRRGLLLLVDNRAVVSVAEYLFDKDATLREQDKMRHLFEDYALVKKRLAEHPAIAQERRMSISLSPATAAPSLLLDCTNMLPTFNGTTECVLGILRGINKNGTGDWKVTAMVLDETLVAFSLAERFPAIQFVPMSNGDRFDVAIRLSQAWSVATLADLSRRARSIAITILDTIAPDIVYGPPPGCEEAFQFAGEHADGLIYISQFSQRQFRRRYVTHPFLIESVIYLSLDPADYVSERQLTPQQGEWILLFGNAYDHKDLSRSIDILATAFPFENFKVVGIECGHLANVEGLPSGDLGDGVIAELYQHAKCVVFPSFYEGFGFPVVRGLANGKTVIARNSSLLHEIAENIPENGRLIAFENSLELVKIVAHLLRGDDYPSLALGGGVGAEARPHGWSECGRQVLTFAKQLRASERPQRWLERDRALQYAIESMKH